MKRFLAACICLLSYMSVYAQTAPSDTAAASADSTISRDNYVFSARTKLTLFVFGNRYLNSVMFSNHGIQANYFPIAPINIGFGFSHKWLALSLSILSPRPQKDKYDENGDPYNNFNFQLLAYTPKYGLDVLYSRNEGYYLGNYNAFLNIIETPDKTPYTNMTSERFMVNVLRIFNSLRYSMNASMVGGEVQKNSSSSFILNASFSYSHIDMGDSIPDYIQSQIDPSAIFMSGHFFSMNILPGYGVTWIVKQKFYFGVIPSLGPSLQFKNMYFETGHNQTPAISYRVLAKFGAGYHSRRWTVGLTLIFDNELYHLGDQSNMMSNNDKLTLRLGYKINVPKWGKNISAKMSLLQERFINTMTNF